ncbi:MAG: hypothetical protein OQK04_10815 [Kangiellaceae bacterium]|nr:hypothetical protein [Kangiellaceae bacterium]MCW8999195.1 hypothetical protein [Kangiellaceae bacterium]
MSTSKAFSPALLQSNNFLKLALVGLVLSFFGMLSFEALTVFYISSESFKAAISIVAITYSIFLLYQTPIKTGKISLLLFYVASQLVLLFWIAPLDLVLLTNLFAIWFVRCIYFHRNFIAAVFDSILLAMGFAASVWSINQTGSLLLGFWCFFLVQALIVFIPELNQMITGGRSKVTKNVRQNLNSNSQKVSTVEPRFDDAYRKACSIMKEIQQSNS